LPAAAFEAFPEAGAPADEGEEGVSAVGLLAEFAGDAGFVGSVAVAGALFVLAAGGTGSVDAAGFVLFTGVALASCADIGTWGPGAGVNDVPFWANASAPASNTNTMKLDHLRDICPPPQLIV